MNVSLTVVGAEQLATAAATAIPLLQARTQAAVRTFAPLLAERIQTAASGRPGPNIVTGNLYGSIGIDYAGIGGDWGSATVGTSVPYANRLEFGFYGTDSLGRHYSQPPYPFFGRAVEGSTDEFIGLVQRAINGG